MSVIAIGLSRYEGLRDYLSLTRPRSVLPHLITSAAAMFVAIGGAPALPVLFFTLLGGGLVAAAANSFNSYLDRDIDALMERTRLRALPSGRLNPNRALALAIGLGMVGIFILSRFVNWPAAVLAVIALAYYVFPYTLWLKRRTFWGAIISSLIGGIPPLIGWVATSSRIQVTPFLLSAIIVLWTIPHFWGLAVFRNSDYHLAGLKMVPANGVAFWVKACSLLLVAMTLFIAPIAGLGLIYLGTAAVCGGILLYLALHMEHGESAETARHLYYYSIPYIAILFSAMIVDRVLF